MAANIIVDSNYVCYVHKFALSQGLTYRGGRTEIIYGFLRTVFDMAEKFDSSRFLFCWDASNSLRRKIYPLYKANRRPDDRPEEDKKQDRLAFHQFDLVREDVLRSLGFSCIYQIEGFESDDLIAKLVKENLFSQENVVISSDNDLYQLLEGCCLYNISKRSLTTKDEFLRNYGLSPDKWSEIKSISGCGTDNVAGVVGIGEKTAAKYVLGSLKDGKTKQKIETEEAKKIIERNRELVHLPFASTPNLDTSQKDSFSLQKFTETFCRYGFSSFLKEDKLKIISKRFLGK